MLVSAADAAGGHGVQFWHRRSRGVCIDKWRAVSPRLMYVSLHVRSCWVAIIVGHAPHEHDDAAVKDGFWNSLNDTYVEAFSKHPAVPWMFLLDGNARVGSVPAACFGPCSPERENDNGARFRCFCSAHGLRAVNTFFN
eukprot:11751022-Karenia_brevis.AAC.1